MLGLKIVIKSGFRFRASVWFGVGFRVRARIGFQD